MRKRLFQRQMYMMDGSNEVSIAEYCTGLMLVIARRFRVASLTDHIFRRFFHSYSLRPQDLPVEVTF